VGSGFSRVSAVTFGSKEAKSFKVDSAGKLVAVSPSGKGSVHVLVTTPGGTNAANPSGAFDYR
jgi:hypothetical protein